MIAALEGGECSAVRSGCTLPPGKTQYPFYRKFLALALKICTRTLDKGMKDCHSSNLTHPVRNWIKTRFKEAHIIFIVTYYVPDTLTSLREKYNVGCSPGAMTLCSIISLTYFHRYIKMAAVARKMSDSC